MGRLNGLRALVWLSAWLSTASACTTPPAPNGACVSIRIGPAGGPFVGPVGFTMIVPAGALAADTDVRVCVLDTAPAAHQRSATFDVQPHGATLSAPCALTVPVQGVLSRPSATLGSGPADPMPSVITDVGAGTGAATFSIARFGVVRVLDEGAPDAGPPDASFDAPFVPRDTSPPPIDAWSAPAPVVVGPDHAPANYACLRMASTPVRGTAPQTVTLRVRDWADHGPRAGYQMRVLEAFPTDTSDTCGATPDCVSLVTDAMGEATVSVRSGWLFVDAFGSLTAIDDAHLPIQQVHAQRVLDPAATTLDVAVISQRSFFALSGPMGGGAWSFGAIHDCDGMPVQRARVRAIDPVTNTDLVDTFGPTLRYGTGSGFPASGTTRSGSDGVYLATLTPGAMHPAMRLEVWGILGSGDEVLLACESVSFETGRPVLLDLDPLHSDADPACGTAP